MKKTILIALCILFLFSCKKKEVIKPEQKIDYKTLKDKMIMH